MDDGSDAQKERTRHPVKGWQVAVSLALAGALAAAAAVLLSFAWLWIYLMLLFMLGVAGFALRRR